MFGKDFAIIHNPHGVDIGNFGSGVREDDFSIKVHSNGLNQEMIKNQLITKNVYNPYWKELILVENILPEPRKEPEFQVVSSYELQDFRCRDILPPYTRIGITALVETLDHKLLFGLANNSIKPITGYANWYEQAQNSLFTTFYQEVESELGITEEELHDTQLIGMQYNPNVRFMNFTFYTHAHTNAMHVVEQHQKGYQVYWAMLQKTDSIFDARKKTSEILQMVGLPVDAWENEIIVPIETDCLLGKSNLERTLTNTHYLPITIGAMVQYHNLMQKS